MDKIFDGRQAQAYENWISSRAGNHYLAASCQLLDHLLNCRPGWRVLDIGCGLGLHLEHLKNHGLLTFGVEPSPILRRVAQERLGAQSSVNLGEAYNLPYEDNSFDAVLMVNSLEYMDRPAVALAEAARVASGRLCVITFNSCSLTRVFLNPFMRPLHFMGLWRLKSLLHQVLGPSPHIWRAASLNARPLVGHFPCMGLMGLCAAVSPRFMTTPLTLELDSQVRQFSRARPISLRVIK